MVGAAGFEPATPWSQARCSTKLSHAPSITRVIIQQFLLVCQCFFKKQYFLEKHLFFKLAVAESLTQLQPTYINYNNIIPILCQATLSRHTDYLLNKSVIAFLFTSLFSLAI